MHDDIEEHFELYHPEPVRVLVTGGRDYDDRLKLFQVLEQLYEINQNIKIIHGAARGADTLADEWANKTGVRVEKHYADWTRHGRSAGAIRNNKMAKSCIDFCVAFPGGNGTKHMIETCENAGIRTWIIK